MSVTITLDTPIVRGETKIESVTLRKPGPGELRGVKLRDLVEADTDTIITVLPRITSPALTEQEVATMDLADFVECANQLSGFLPQKAARTVSPTA